MDINQKITEELGVKKWQVEAAVKLIDEGNTIPFISRYRKEATGSLNDEQLRKLYERLMYLRNLEEKKEQVLATIEEQGKLTEELKLQILAAETLVVVEDLYRPYRPKRRTRATIAKEKGLEPLAALITLQKTKVPIEEAAKSYISEEKEVKTAGEAINGAKDIIAEYISDEADYRIYIRDLTAKQGKITSIAKDAQTESVYEMYYEFEEPITKLAGHRILALNRGEKEKILTVKVEAPEERILQYLEKKVISSDNVYTTPILQEVIEDSYKRLIAPAIEREIRSALTETAEAGAIKVFGKNLKQLLMQPPVAGRVVLGWDPAFRTGCKLAVVELPDAGLASALPNMPVCAVTAIGPDGVSRSVERLAALAAGVMRKDAVCVTAPEQPKAVLSELVVAAAKAECELVVPDAEDITFLEAEKFTSKVDYGGYTAPLAFLGRHAAGNAAVAVELALALWRKGFEIPDEAILAGLAAVENRSSIRVLSQKPLIILDACRTPQQAAALLRVLNMAKVRHMSAVIGLTEEEGAESFLAALETGLTSEEQKKDKSTMPGMGENPFDKVFLVAPAGTEAALAERLTEKARYHFDAVFCPTLAEAVEQAKANSRRGLLVCGSEAIALEALKLFS